MDAWEKLVELLAQKVCDAYSPNCDEWEPHDCGKCYANDCHISDIADHLIANDVTVQEWISVKDRLPDLIPCNAGTAYSEAVNILTTGRKVFTAIFDGDDFIGDAEFWEAEGEEVTHWTPVLLPLPQPPKGECE